MVLFFNTFRSFIVVLNSTIISSLVRTINFLIDSVLPVTKTEALDAISPISRKRKDPTLGCLIIKLLFVSK